MSKLPFPWPVGEPQSLRASLWKALHGRALAEGKDVVLTRAQLRGAFPRGRQQHPSLPESYDHELYVLRGLHDLTPVED